MYCTPNFHCHAHVLLRWRQQDYRRYSLRRLFGDWPPKNRGKKREKELDETNSTYILSKYFVGSNRAEIICLANRKHHPTLRIFVHTERRSILLGNFHEE